MGVCFICQKNLSSDKISVVKKQGVQGLLSASIERGEEGHEKKLRALDSVTIHTSCWRAYTRKENIIAAVRRRSADSGASTSSSASFQRPSTPVFDFHSLCFICGKEADANFIAQQSKLSPKNRKLVSLVKSNDVRDTVYKHLFYRDDAESRDAIKRIENIPDLPAVGARYHRQCSQGLSKFPTQRTSGRPASNEVDKAMNDIFDFIEANADECQFTVAQLMAEIKGDFRPHISTVKIRLVEKYGDGVVLFESKGVPPIVCLKNITGHKLLINSWYESRASDPREERLRVLREAAAIIVEDIRAENYDTASYSPPDNFLHDSESQVPESLRTFLSEVILSSKKGASKESERKCVSIAHAIVSAVRPRSFTSPVLLGIGAFIYKKFGSKTLINILHNIGFSESYKEILHFETSSIAHEEPRVLETGFMQFVFDNADFNTRTLDGYGTFHAMGGIQCITPSNSIAPDTRILKCSEKKSSVVSSKMADFELKHYTKAKNEGLATLQARDLDTLRKVSPDVHVVPSEFLWFYGKWMCDPPIPGWSGFMENANAHLQSSPSTIKFLPFLNAPPTDCDTVYSSLILAAEKTALHSQGVCFVTFDQQLYWIARDIVAAAAFSPEMTVLEKVVVRLGGFHLAKNFVGAIGKIMSGSGLEEIFALIYAGNGVPKLLDGTAYSRAIRAHSLVRTALGRTILDNVEFEDDERDEIENILMDIDRSAVVSNDENSLLATALEKFHRTLRDLESKGPTARLWIQYFDLTTLLVTYIQAERSGNWYLHLDTVRRMLPIFHAAGHFNYAKSVHLYLQDMESLREMLPRREFEMFVNQSFFAVRRTDKFFSGVWTDLVIEQSLMRSMKVKGGLIGRGFTENTTTTFTTGMIAMQNVCHQIENFCNVTCATSEEHVDSTKTRVTRDTKEVGDIYNWFAKKNPFCDNDELVSLSTGIVGTSDINCHQAFQVGTKMMSNVVGLSFDALKTQRIPETQGYHFFPFGHD